MSTVPLPQKTRVAHLIRIGQCALFLMLFSSGLVRGLRAGKYLQSPNPQQICITKCYLSIFDVLIGTRLRNVLFLLRKALSAETSFVRKFYALKNLADANRSKYSSTRN